MNSSERMEMDRFPGRIIFVVGNSRSGTTMLSRMLGASQMVHSFPELHFFEGVVSRSEVRERRRLSSQDAISLLNCLLMRARVGLFAKPDGRFSADAMQIMEGAPGRDAISLYREFLVREAKKNGASIPLEQTPRYLFSVGDLLGLFPDVRIVNMVRDPRDVLVSQKHKWRRRGLGERSTPLREVARTWANYHPWTISKLWSACVKEGLAYAGDERVITVRFEDLGAEPEQVVRRICRFCGVDFEERMMQIPKVGSSIAKDDSSDRGFAQDRVNRWKTGILDRTSIGICEWVAGNEMKSVGYEMIGNAKFSPRFLPSLLAMPIKGAIALALNLDRYRNVAASLRRRFA